MMVTQKGHLGSFAVFWSETRQPTVPGLSHLTRIITISTRVQSTLLAFDFNADTFHALVVWILTFYEHNSYGFDLLCHPFAFTAELTSAI